MKQKFSFRKVSANVEVRLQTSYQKTKKEKVVSLNWIVLFKETRCNLPDISTKINKMYMFEQFAAEFLKQKSKMIG